MKKLISAILSTVCLLTSIGLVPIASAETENTYIVPESGAETYNMNIDWRFLLPTQSDTLSNALSSSKDSNGKYFYDTDYQEESVTGTAYKDAVGNSVEGDKWSTVSIPHAINGLQTYVRTDTKGKGGMGTRCLMLYRKTFTVPQSAQDGKVFFAVEGIRQAAYVWVNGHKFGYYEAGITAFGFDITQYVIAGQQAVIAIAADGTSSGGAESTLTWKSEMNRRRIRT